MPAVRRNGIAPLALIPLLCAMPVAAQVPDAPPDTVADIPVNYTEALVGSYTLPDPLILQDGTPVRDAQLWMQQRRPELIRLFEEHQYGRSPGRPAEMVFDVFDTGTPALDGRAIRRQVTLYFNNNRTGPTLDLLVYFPAGATDPVPLFLNVSFSPNSNVVDDPGIKPSYVWNREERARVPATPGRNFGRLDPLPFLEAGIAVATVYYADLDPDFPDGASLGIRGEYLEEGETELAPDQWGSIAAWSWGLRRVMDYFETDMDIDDERVALFGASRVGKTVLWTAARDPRFAAVIAKCLGGGRRRAEPPKLWRDNRASRRAQSLPVPVREELRQLRRACRRVPGGRAHASRPDRAPAGAAADGYGGSLVGSAR